MKIKKTRPLTIYAISFLNQHFSKILALIHIFIGWQLLIFFLNNLKEILPAYIYIDYLTSFLHMRFEPTDLFAYRWHWLIIFLSVVMVIILEFINTYLASIIIYKIKTKRPEKNMKIRSFFQGIALDEWPLGKCKYSYYKASGTYLLFLITGLISIFIIIFYLKKPILNLLLLPFQINLFSSYFFTYLSIKLLILSSWRFSIIYNKQEYAYLKGSAPVMSELWAILVLNGFFLIIASHFGFLNFLANLNF